MRLNEKNIRGSQPGKGNRITYDDEVKGFGIRITGAGSKAFVLNYRIDGRERRMTIGSWPAWTATAARTRAKELRVLIDRGEDPLAKKQKRRAAATFGDVARHYLENHASKKASGHVDRARLERDVLPDWENRKAADITRGVAWTLLKGKAKEAPVAANRLLALVRKVFNWAIYDEDALEFDFGLTSNPCHRMKPPGGAEEARTRVLDADEIRQLWQGLANTELSMSGEVRDILTLVLATAQRPGEVCAMEWAEIHSDSGWWTIPSDKSKNRQPHRIPLLTVAQEILGRRSSEGRWVFPSPRGEGAIAVNALTHALRVNAHLGLELFTAHDLRRTSSDWMASQGIDGRSRSAVLNHKAAGVTEKHYTVYSYDREKRVALNKWDAKLRDIISGESGKVVAIG